MKKAIFGYGGHAREVEVQLNEKLTFFVDDEYSNQVCKPLSEFNADEYEIIIAVADPIKREEILKKPVKILENAEKISKNSQRTSRESLQNFRKIPQNFRKILQNLKKNLNNFKKILREKVQKIQTLTQYSSTDG